MSRFTPRLLVLRSSLSLVALVGLVGLAALAAPGCGSSSKKPAAAQDGEPSEVAEPAGSSGGNDRLVAGDYACSFGSYPEFLCRVVEDGEFVTLEKLGGSERFRGSLSRDDDGAGVRWTNAEAEGSPAELLFQPRPDGSWFAAIPADGEPLGYRLRFLGEPGSQFGGQSYAGAIGEATE